jgi:hypothetical protein
MKEKHIHKYRRIKIGKNKDYVVYKCFLDCPHYITPELVIGRMSICWYCGNEFEMTKASLKLKPTCGCYKQGTPRIEEIDEEDESDLLLKNLGLKDD